MKKVLSLWKVIVLVISSLVGVAGATALTLYLSGHFNEEVIEPQDIYFEKVLSEGDGSYNLELSQFEVASDSFKMLISSSTENVTETSVKLSLLGQGAVVDGFISDGVVKVKQYVEINKPFVVTLEQTFDNSLENYLVLGGVSHLTATSSNVLISPQSVTIAVDCPVDGLKLNVAREAETDETDALVQTVVVGEEFTLDVEFLPELSANMFSDETRKKEIFYSFPESSSYVEYDWEREKFVAVSVSGENADKISAFTFKTAHYQQLMMQQYSYITSRKELTSMLLRDMELHPEKYVSETLEIKVDNVGVVKFALEGGDKEFRNVSFDKKFLITANSTVGDASLNLTIEDDDQTQLTALYSNVGLRLPTEVENFNLLSFEGGKLIKVEFLNGIEKPRITKINFANDINWAENAEGVEKTMYYLLPSAPKGAASKNYSWEFSIESVSNESLTFEFKANLFYQNAEGEFVAFCDMTQDGTKKEPTVKLVASSTAQGIEEGIGWDPDHMETLSMVVNYDDAGVLKSDNEDLENYIGPIPSKNLYQTLKYFLVLPKELEADGAFDVTEYFVCENGKQYVFDYLGNELSISNVDMDNGSYTLYELPGSLLIAKKNFSGKAYVVAATVKTKANGALYTDNGKYVIVKMTSGKEVTVDSSLSIANITPTFEMVQDDRVFVDDESGKIFLPAVAKNESGDDMDLVTFKLVLANCETFETDYKSNSDVSKVLKAVEGEKLRIEAYSGATKGEYVTLKGFRLADEGADPTTKTATFEATLQINKSQIQQSSTKDMTGTPVELRLVYEDGVNIYQKQILSPDGKAGFNVYNQQACSIEGAFEKEAALKDANGYYPIYVDVSAAGTTISWGPTGSAPIGLERLNELLSFEIKDQFGKLINKKDGIYRVKLEESTDKNILSFNLNDSAIQNFNTTNDTETTGLNAFVLKTLADGSEVKVGKFDAEGNLIYGADGNIEVLSAPTLTFNIKSESLAAVWFDAQDAGIGYEAANPADSAEWKKSSSTSTVVIERYVTANDEFVLNDVVKMFVNDVSGLEDPEWTNNYKKTEFYFDSTFLNALSNEDAKNLKSMLSEVKLATGETAPDDETNLKNYAGKKLTSIKFAYPFSDDENEIVFKATGVDGTLFDVTIKLVCLADLTINSSAFTEYENKFGNYIVSKDVADNKIRIFGNQLFKLDSYFALSSYTDRATGDAAYSWESLTGNDVGKVSNYSIIDPSGKASIVKKGEDYYLSISEVYDYTDLEVSLFYGPKSDYSCSVTLNFYIQPNFVVRQNAIDNVVEGTSTNFDISKINSEADLSKYFELHRLVATTSSTSDGYLNTDGSVVAFNADTRIESADIGGWFEFENETSTTGKYIKIEDENIRFESGKTIDFAQGETYVQRFNLKYEEDTNLFKAVRIIDGYDKDQVIVDASGVKLEFNLTLGSVGSELLSGVQTITFDGKEYYLLVPNKTYNVESGYEIKNVVSASNLLRKSGSAAIATNGIPNGFVNYEANQIVLSKQLKDDAENSLTATIMLRAFISGVGDKFVYYNNAAFIDGVLDNSYFDATTIEFNKFQYDLFDAEGNVVGSNRVDLKDILELNDDKIYQEVTAGGNYTVVHNSDNAVPTTIENAIGFYFSHAAAGAYAGGFSANKVAVSVEEDKLGLATLSKVNDIDDYETVLTLKPLEKNFAEKYTDNYGGVYVILKIEVFEYQNQSNSFAWYYRLKVNPNFVVEDVAYPFAGDAEYLSPIHSSFDGEKYQINLEEEFNKANSADKMGTRFAKPYKLDGTTEIAADATYSITEIKVGEKTYSTPEELALAKCENFETLGVDAEGNFVAKLLSTKDINVTVSKAYKFGETEMVGSLRNYIFKFNQSGSYIHTVSANGTLISKEDDTAIIHNQSMKAADGEYVYNAVIRADAGNGIYTNVADFGAYVKALNGASLSDALKPYDSETGTTTGPNAKYKYGVAAGTAGTVTFAGMTTDYTTPTDLSYEFDDRLDLSGDTVEVDVELGGTTVTATIKSEDVIDQTCYYYFDEDNNLKITPLDSIKQDVEFEIGYYVNSTTQTDIVSRAVFKIDVDINSYFSYTLNTAEFEGGKTYSVVGTSGLLTQLTSSSSTISSFEIELTNGEVEYAGEGIAEGVTLNDLIKINTTGSGSTPDYGTIEFAHMPYDATFKFKGVINKGDTDEYSFWFNVVVKANVDLTKTRLFDASAGAERYSNVSFEVESGDIDSSVEFENSDNGFYKFKNATPDEDGKTKTEITYPTYVDVVTYPTQYLDLTYQFNDKDIFDFVVDYKYKVAPSLAVESNYPMPDGEKEMQAEHVSTTNKNPDSKYNSTLNDFFNSKAPFASENRILITHEATGVDEANFLKDVGENWTIMISRISNLELDFTGSYYNYNGTSLESESINTTASSTGTIINNTLLKGEDASDEKRPIVNITFKIANPSSKGEVDFAVVVNGVTTTYSVVVELGTAYKADFNKPNATNNIESIYAEDLVDKSLKIFEKDRIANFTTKESVAEGTYYLRFVNKTNPKEIQTPKIQVVGKDQLLNIDLGKSYSDYNYDGIFATETLAKSGAEKDKKDSDLFVDGLKLTERFVAKYGGVEIKFATAGAGVQLKLKERITLFNGEKFEYKTNDAGEYEYANLDNRGGEGESILAYNYKVSEEFFEKPVAVDFYLVDETGEMSLGSTYGYLLDIEFEVKETADDVSSYTTHEIDANGGNVEEQTPYLLMELVNIYNKRTDVAYGSTGLANSVGTIDLKIYGFSDLPVDDTNSITLDAAGVEYINSASTEEAKLQRVAGYLHKQLMSTAATNGVKYYTGLIPNYKMNGINDASVSSNSFENFISIAGDKTGKTLDYKIFAHAANNDGNHVMMRLAYTVDIDGGDSETGIVTKYHNLLFKVLPNSTALFETGHKTENYIEGANEVVDGRSVVTNYQQIYEINGDSEGTAISLWDESGDEGAKSSIKMQMYGTSMNVAKEFNYKIALKKQEGSVVYNDWENFRIWLETKEYTSSKKYWIADNETSPAYFTSNKEIPKLEVDTQTVTLGSRDYLVEFENVYGFKARFYFRYVAKTNPQILDVTADDGVFIENSNIAFVSNYYMVTPSRVSGNRTYIDLGTIDYKKESVGGYDYYPDAVYATGISSIMATVTMNDGKAYKRTLGVDNTLNQNTYSIWGSADAEWESLTEGDGTKKFTFAEFVSQLSQVQLGMIPSDDYEIYHLKNVVRKNGPESTDGDGNNTIDNSWNLFVPTAEDASGNMTEPSISGLPGDLLSSDCSPKTLTTTYTKSSSANTPKVTLGTYTVNTVNIGGLNAWAFKTEDAIDKKAVGEESGDVKPEYKSDVNNVQVQSVDFYYDNQWIGGSWATGTYKTDYESGAEYFKNGESDSSSTLGASIITDKNVVFINGPKVSDKNSGKGGTIADTPQVFKVPYIEGAYFGSGDILSGVTMKVTLIENDQTTAITTEIKIKRQSKSENLFETTNLQDGSQPVVKSDDSATSDSVGGLKNGSLVLNDTIEVVMPASSKINFMIHDKEIVYTDWNGETATQAIDVDGNVFAPKIITLSNVNKYEMVEYVGISRNIVGLKANKDKDDEFYLYDFGSNDSENLVKFNYNGGEEISAASIENKYVNWLKYSTLAYNGGTAEEPKLVETISITPNDGEMAQIAFVAIKPVDTNGDGTVDEDEKQTQTSNYILSNYTKLNFVEYKDNDDTESTATTYGIKISDLFGSLKEDVTILAIEKGTWNGDSFESKLAEMSYKLKDETTGTRVSEFASIQYSTKGQYTVGAIGVYYGKEINSTGAVTTTYNIPANALNLRINHVDELTSEWKKSETLYFLLSENGETYQFSEEFVVHPTYRKAQEYENNVAGNNKFTLDEFMVVENGYETYYIITLDQWAKNIYLTNEACGIKYTAGATTDNKSLASMADAYKFYYRINSTLGGSAFIDENGMITTTVDYEIKTHQMSVDVFMKVSGSDGNFEEPNTTIKLGTFVMNLDPDKVTSNKSNKMSGSGSKIVDGNIITLDENAELYSNTEKTDSGIDAAATLLDSTQQSFKVGELVDFETMFGHKTLQNSEETPEEVALTEITNRNYHIVKDTINGEESYVYYNNLNTWTFSKAGVHKIDVVVTGRDGSGNSVIYLIKDVTILVYDTAINEENIYSNADLTESGDEWKHNLDEAYVWYSKDADGKITLVGNNEAVVNKDSSGTCIDGIITKDYLAIEKVSDEAKIIYNDTEQTAGYFDLASDESTPGTQDFITALKIKTSEGAVGKVWLSTSEIVDTEGLTFIEINSTDIDIEGEDFLDKINMKENEQIGLVSSGEATTLAEGEEETSKTIVSRIFYKVEVMAPKGEIKNVRYTYFIHSAEATRTIALQKTETYELKNMAENSDSKYKFFDKETYEEINSISFDYGEHSETEKEVYMLETTNEGEETLTLLTIKVKIVGSAVSEKTLVINTIDFENEYIHSTTPEYPVFEKVKEKIVESFAELSSATFKTKSEFAGYNVWMLEKMNGYSLEEATTALNKVAGADTPEEAGDDEYEFITRYLVTYKNAEGKTKFFRIVFNFIKTEKVITVEENIEANNAYQLSTLNNIIKEKLFIDGSIEGDVLSSEEKAYTVNYYKLEGEKLVEFTVIDAENGHEETYLVLINNKYYQVDIKLNIAP